MDRYLRFFDLDEREIIDSSSEPVHDAPITCMTLTKGDAMLVTGK